MLETFCGHVYMETVYTKANKAMMGLRSTLMNVRYPTSLVASYVVHTAGWAYKFSYGGDYNDTTNNIVTLNDAGWNVPISLGQILFIEQSMFYIWYIANDVLDFAYLTYQQIQITSFECREPTLEIRVYPGLLSYYMMKWQVKPFRVVDCNLTEAQFIDLTFHMYATVVLAMPALQPPINIAMSVVSRQQEFLPAKRELMVKALSHTDRTLQTGYIHGSSNYLLIQSLTHDGHKHTARYHDIQGPSHNRDLPQYGSIRSIRNTEFLQYGR